MKMLPLINLGNLRVTRLILGGNPFSGFSHQTPAKDREMLDYYKVERIKETFRRAEASGINTVILRVDAFILRLLREYKNEGGNLQWIAQVATDAAEGWEAGFEQAVASGAKACYLHGAELDNLYQEKNAGKLVKIVNSVNSLGVPIGLAGHDPQGHIWAQELDIPIAFHVVCFYNCGSIHAGKGERFKPEDPPAAVDVIRRIRKPCIGYKIMGAGRTEARKAFQFAFANIKPADCVNVGMYRGDNDKMVEENAAMVRDILANLSVTKKAEEKGPA